MIIIKGNCENSLSVNSETNLHYQPAANLDPLCGRLFSLRLREFELALMLAAGATDLHTGGWEIAKYVWIGACTVVSKNKQLSPTHYLTIYIYTHGDQYIPASLPFWFPEEFDPLKQRRLFILLFLTTQRKFQPGKPTEFFTRRHVGALPAHIKIVVVKKDKANGWRTSRSLT